MPNRHLSRIIIMQTLYEWDFKGSKKKAIEIVKRNIKNFIEDCDEKFIIKNINGIVDNIDRIDQIIVSAAPEWPLDQIAVIDKTILRSSIYELMFDKEIPPKVVINESVELAKSYGSESSSKFVNGVLGTLFKQDPRYEEEGKTEEDKSSLMDLINDKNHKTQSKNKNL